MRELRSPGMICLGLGLWRCFLVEGLLAEAVHHHLPWFVTPGLATLFAMSREIRGHRPLPSSNLTANQSVTWAVTGGSGMARLAERGLYTAPGGGAESCDGHGDGHATDASCDRLFVTVARLRRWEYRKLR